MENQMKRLKKEIDKISKLPKLKPCPFCGEKKHVIVEEFLVCKFGESSFQYLPFCNNKKCLFAQMNRNQYMRDDDIKYDTKKQAIQAWNKRPEEKKLIEKISELSRDLNRKD